MYNPELETWELWRIQDRIGTLTYRIRGLDPKIEVDKEELRRSTTELKILKERLKLSELYRLKMRRPKLVISRNISLKENKCPPKKYLKK